jgi:CheY-like chemotaxis protein
MRNNPKMRVILLLTRDPQFEKLMRETLRGEDTIVLARHSAAEALVTICGREQELNIVVIDFAEECHGMTMLGTIKGCRPDLPIIAVTSSDLYDSAELAYANHVDCCLARSVSSGELKLVLDELRSLKPLLECGLTKEPELCKK